MKTKTLQIKNTPQETIDRLKKWCELKGGVEYAHLLKTDKRLKDIVL